MSYQARFLLSAVERTGPTPHGAEVDRRQTTIGGRTATFCTPHARGEDCRGMWTDEKAATGRMIRGTVRPGT